MLEKWRSCSNNGICIVIFNWICNFLCCFGIWGDVYMIDVLWNIVYCIGLVALALIGILLCAALVGSIVKLIKIFKENV